MSQSQYGWWPAGQVQGTATLGQQMPLGGVTSLQTPTSGAMAPMASSPEPGMGQTGGTEMPATGQSRVVVPAIDVYETADEILVLADTPGFDQDDIELHADEQSLLLKATREQEADEGRTPLLQERPTHLERVVQVPPGADIEGAKATHDDGVCTVRIPKNESRRRLTIAFQ